MDNAFQTTVENHAAQMVGTRYKSARMWICSKVGSTKSLARAYDKTLLPHQPSVANHSGIKIGASTETDAGFENETV